MAPHLAPSDAGDREPEHSRFTRLSGRAGIGPVIAEPAACDGTRLIGPSLVTEPEFGLFGTLTGPLDGTRVAGQDAVELAARGDAELGEDLAQVVCDGVCTDE